jgi:hypothetical protein
MLRIVLPTKNDPFAGFKYLASDEARQDLRRPFVVTATEAVADSTPAPADASSDQTDTPADATEAKATTHVDVEQIIITTIRARIIDGCNRVLRLGANILSGIVGAGVWFTELATEAILLEGLLTAATGAWSSSWMVSLWNTAFIPAAQWVLSVAPAWLPEALAALSLNPVTAIAAVIVGAIIVLVLATRRESFLHFWAVIYRVTFQVLAFAVEIVRNLVGAVLFLVGAAIAALNAGTAFALFALKWAVERIGGLHNLTFAQAVEAAGGRTEVQDLPAETSTPKQGQRKQPKGKRPHPARANRHLKPVTA